MDAVHVVNAADEAYVPHAAAMLHSLLAHNPGESFHVHFLHREGVDAKPLARLEALCAGRGARFTPHPVPRSWVADLPVRPPFTEEAWYRVVLPELLPALDRVLWLDADVIVLAPLRELWETDLAGQPLAACPNAVMWTFRDVIQDLGIRDRHLYFNSGVLLMDLARMRAEGSRQALAEAAHRVRGRIRFADQDALNLVYHRRYRRLRLKWNVLSQAFSNVPETIRVHGREEFDEAMAAPAILHFTGTARYKPWFHTSSHPYRDHYVRHRLAAGWPPPEYPDRTLWTSLVRRLPFRAREVINALRRLDCGEALSYFRNW